jgi:hypothetical protein
MELVTEVSWFYASHTYVATIGKCKQRRRGKKISDNQRGFSSSIIERNIRVQVVPISGLFVRSVPLHFCVTTVHFILASELHVNRR